MAQPEAVSLTEHQAYLAMERFVRAYRDRARASDLAVLLSDIEVEADGRPHDPAAWTDWRSCVRAVLDDER
jgi:hypothetical protein